jgi:hypothetical protein
MVWAALRAMTADGMRDMLWLHAERGDWRKQRQQAKDRHEEVQRFFHACRFDAVPNGFDTDWNELICYFDSILLRREGGKNRFFWALYSVRAGANKNNCDGALVKIAQRRRSSWQP